MRPAGRSFGRSVGWSVGCIVRALSFFSCGPQGTFRQKVPSAPPPKSSYWGPL